MTEDLAQYLEPGPTVQSDHPDVISFARKWGGDATDHRQIAVNLYYAVRDRIRYAVVDRERIREARWEAETEHWADAY